MSATDVCLPPSGAAADAPPIHALKERRRRPPQVKTSPSAGSGVIYAAPGESSPSSPSIPGSPEPNKLHGASSSTGAGARASNDARICPVILRMPPTCSQPMSQARKIAAVMIAAGHVFALIGVWQMLSMPSALLGFKWFLAATAFYLVSGTTGITAGAHRLWSHRSYRAALPARVWIALCNTIANQSSILHWSKEHRVHHQYADTAADPYDITRGLFYAHMGWLYAPRTDAYALAVKRLDVSDMLSDPVVRLQDKYYVPLSLLCCFILPTLIGGYLSGGLYWQAFCILGCYRWIFTLHVTWTVNSFAHWIGDRPYDDASEARETRAVSIFSGGEGWHNFHHAYPWDYAASETAAVDVFWRFNLTKFWIDSLAALGLVYDRKVVRNPVRALERVRAAEAAAPPGDEHALYRGRF